MRCHLRLLFILSLGVACLPAAEPDPLEKAKSLYDQNRYAEAKVAFDALAQASPDNPELLFWQGQTEVVLGLVEPAVAHLERAVALRPNEASFYDVLGDAYGLSAQKASLFSKMGFAKKCIAAYDRAVALAPDDVEYRKSRYEFYREAPSIVGGGSDKAAAEIAEIEKRDPIQGGGLRADILNREGKNDEAFALLDGLHKKYPDSEVNLFQLGRMAAMTGQRLDDGEVALRKYLLCKPKPDDPPLWAAHWRLAIVLEKKGLIAEARAHYEETLRLNPSFARARNSLARLPAAPAIAPVKSSTP